MLYRLSYRINFQKTTPFLREYKDNGFIFKMAKKNQILTSFGAFNRLTLLVCLTFLLLAFSFPLAITAQSDSPTDRKELLARGETDFEAGRYTAALETFSSLYEHGIYNEKMLYQLAFIHENLRQYPDAIFFLKKIRQEYGGKNLGPKVHQLMQKNGTARYLTEDPATDYLLFMSRFAWVGWILFLPLMVWLIYFFLSRNSKTPALMNYLTRFVSPIFLLVVLILGHYYFFRPQQAVLIQKTAYYDFPSYGAGADFSALSTGETVEITGSEDIWYEITAGDNVYWVPQFVLRKL